MELTSSLFPYRVTRQVEIRLKVVSCLFMVCEVLKHKTMNSSQGTIHAIINWEKA